MRNYRDLRVFQAADALVFRVYELSLQLPDNERYGLQSQTRRAAVSVAANLVEGAERSTGQDFARFVNVAAASASEVQYLLTVARRLGYLDAPTSTALERDYQDLRHSLLRLQRSVETTQRA